MTRYGGELPGDEATLRSFKGIGAYTAGAVLSFAFGQRAAILDTNVARVLFRVFVGAGDPKSHAMRRHLWDVSRTVLPMRHVFDFNQALMDFGATLLHGTQAAVPDLSAAQRMRRVSRSIVPDQTTWPLPPHRRDCRGDRGERQVPRDPAAGWRASRRLLGVPGRQV